MIHGKGWINTHQFAISIHCGQVCDFSVWSPGTVTGIPFDLKFASGALTVVSGIESTIHSPESTPNPGNCEGNLPGKRLSSFRTCGFSRETWNEGFIPRFNSSSLRSSWYVAPSFRILIIANGPRNFGASLRARPLGNDKFLRRCDSSTSGKSHQHYNRLVAL